MRERRRRNEKNKNYSFLSNLKFMAGAYWQQKKLLLLLPPLQIPVKSVIALLGIYLPKLVVDSLEGGGDYRAFLGQVAGISAVLLAVNLLQQYLEVYQRMQVMRVSSSHFLLQMNGRAMDMDYAQFSAPQGKILFDKAVQSIRGGFGSTLNGFLPAVMELLANLLGFVSFCVIIARLNIWIIPLLLLSYTIDGLLMMRVEKWIQKTKNARSAIFRKLRYIAYATRSAETAKDIRIYSMSAWLRDLGAIFSRENAVWEYKVMRRRLAVAAFEGILVFLRDGAAYVYLIWRVLNGVGEDAIRTGDFLLYFAAIAGFGDWLSSVVSNAETTVETGYALSDYRTFLDHPDEMNRAQGVAVPRRGETAGIRLEHVSFRYPQSEKVVLEDVSIDIRPGEKVAVVGVNGAGKTTLVKLICGLLPPSAGTVYLNDIPVSGYARDDYYSAFTAVFQDVSLLPASIAKNIAFCADSEIDTERVWHCIALAGLREKIESLPKGADTTLVANVLPDAVTLSGGEMQRLLLARAVYSDAAVMILDEPTAALDPIAENEVYLKYNEITQGKTTIYISHRLSSTRFCDRILLLDGAVVAEQGSHDELMAQNGKYAELFRVQSHYYQETLEKEAAAL